MPCLCLSESILGAWSTIGVYTPCTKRKEANRRSPLNYPSKLFRKRKDEAHDPFRFTAIYLSNGNRDEIERKVAKANWILFGQFCSKRIENNEKLVKLELELDYKSIRTFINGLFSIRLVCLCFELNMKFVIFLSLRKIEIKDIIYQVNGIDIEEIYY